MAGFRGDVTLPGLGILNLDNLVDIEEILNIPVTGFRRINGN